MSVVTAPRGFTASPSADQVKRKVSTVTACLRLKEYSTTAGMFRLAFRAMTPSLSRSARPLALR